jgi:CheY-like chemotaxis protein
MEHRWPPTQSGRIILLAEDEFSIRSLVLAILQEAGYNVIVAVDAHDGLEKSRQFKGTIHLLLSDVEMPNMTGIELATQIQIDRSTDRKSVYC